MRRGRRVIVGLPSIAALHGNAGWAGHASVKAGVRGLFEHMDPPDHIRFRRWPAGRFALRRLGLVPRIEESTVRYADARLRRRPPADLVADHSVPVSAPVLREPLAAGDPTGELLRRRKAEPVGDVLGVLVAGEGITLPRSIGVLSPGTAG
jgi:cytochrome P450